MNTFFQLTCYYVSSVYEVTLLYMATTLFYMATAAFHIAITSLYAATNLFSLLAFHNGYKGFGKLKEIWKLAEVFIYVSDY